MKNLNDIYGLEFSFEEGKKACVVIAGVKGNSVFAYKKKSIPKFDSIVSGKGGKVGYKAGKIAPDGKTIEVWERTKKTPSMKESEIWQKIGEFTPSKIETTASRIVYSVKKYYGEFTLNRPNCRIIYKDDPTLKESCENDIPTAEELAEIKQAESDSDKENGEIFSESVPF